MSYESSKVKHHRIYTFCDATSFIFVKKMSGSSAASLELLVNIVVANERHFYSGPCESGSYKAYSGGHYTVG